MDKHNISYQNKDIVHKILGEQNKFKYLGYIARIAKRIYNEEEKPATRSQNSDGSG